ncbi:MAG: hypothetical protein AAGH57_13970 [Pseudomonadota bacterium]
MSERAAICPSLGVVRGALALGLLGGAMGSALHAQSENSPDTFSLPQETPTPTPSPAVQGPLDERSGVRVAPRAITPEPVLPQAPSPTPSPSTSPTRAPETAPAAPMIPVSTPTPTPTPPPTSTPSPTSSPTTVPTQAPDLADEAEEITPLSEAPTPGDEALAGPLLTQREEGAEQSSDFLVGEGEWIDVAPSPSIDLGPPVPATPQGTTDYSPPASADAPWLWALIALGLAALGWIAWRVWCARPAPQLRLETDVVSGVRERISATYGAKSEEKPQGSRQPAREPAPSPSDPAPPAAKAKAKAEANTDAALASTKAVLPLFMTVLVTGATRSVRTFTLNFRVTIANRSDRAVRDLNVSAQLTSAQRGGLNEPSIGLTQSIGAIDRIGPQQSQTLSGSLPLPMADIRLIKQGAVPVFIPLLHVSLEGDNQRTKTESFVIGTPSETSQQRLHPIALDGSPGAVQGLRANLIKPFVSEEEASPSQA